MFEWSDKGALSIIGWMITGAVVAGMGIAAWLLWPTLFVDPTPDEALEAPLFIEEAAAAGVVHSYTGGYDFFVGGGVAVFDCNDDHLPDLYFAGGESPAVLYENESEVGGLLSFSSVGNDVTDQVGVTGAYPIDIDGDGILDLAVLRFGENHLLKGLGGCVFEKANERWGFNGGNEWTAGFSATWEAAESMPTLAFGNYVDTTQDFACSDNFLVRPEGESYGGPQPLSPGFCSLSMLFSDWDRSGKPDLRVTNDKHYYGNTEGEEQLWEFEDTPEPDLYTREEGWKKVQIWGMGIAAHDVTGDGYPEVFLTSQGDNKLQTLANGPTQPEYEDIAIRRGVTAHRPFDGSDILPSTAWHPEFDDVNNDGFVDLYISKGNVEAQPDHAAEDPNNMLLGQPDGTFVESAAEAGIMNTWRTRGAALIDLNLDGMLDLIEVNRVEPVTLWRNVGSGTGDAPRAIGNWVSVALADGPPNRNGIGAWIEVRVGDVTITREVTIGGGHAGGQLGWIHFGVGGADEVDLRVQWPGGETTDWIKLEANQFATIERGEPEAVIWHPPSA